MPRAVSTSKELGALRQDLLEAAMRVLREQGALHLTLRRVAEAAATSTMGIYTCFGGRSGLLEAIYEHGFHLLHQQMNASVTSTDTTPQPHTPLTDPKATSAATNTSSGHDANPPAHDSVPGGEPTPSPRISLADRGTNPSARTLLSGDEADHPVTHDALAGHNLDPASGDSSAVRDAIRPVPDALVGRDANPPARNSLTGGGANPPTRNALDGPDLGPASGGSSAGHGADPDPLARIMAVARGYRRFALADPALYALMFERPLPDFDPSPEQRDDALRLCFDPLTQVTSAAAQAGLIRSTDPQRAAYLVWTTIHGLVSIELTCSLRSPLPGWFLNSEEEGERILTDGVQALLSGLT